MSIIINAGSENKGGTFEQAKINAEEWLKNIHEDITNVIKKYEDELIRQILTILYIPKYKLEDMLRSDTIIISMPLNIFSKIDFQQFSFPSKIIFQPHYLDDLNIIVYGYNKLLNINIWDSSRKIYMYDNRKKLEHEK